jgi:hypothetical protein
MGVIALGRAFREMSYVFIFRPVAVWVSYMVDDETGYGEMEGGARVEVRRITELPGHRRSAEGFSIPPISESGIWRADLLLELNPPTLAPHYHHHPNFRDVNGHRDVGDRCLDPEAFADPVAWTTEKIRRLDLLMAECGVEELVGDLDMQEVERVLPAVAAAIAECLSRVPTLVELRAHEFPPRTGLLGLVTSDN